MAYGIVQVNATFGQSMVVNITRASGGVPVAYTDATLATPIALPATISSTTQFFMVAPESYVISVKVNGQESATSQGTTLTSLLPENDVLILAPSPSLSAEVTANSSTYLPRYSKATIDICTDFSVAPGSDVTTALQSAINQLKTAGVSGEIFFSRPGTYYINGALQTGSAGGGPGSGGLTTTSWSGQVLYPALDSTTAGLSIHIRGVGKPSPWNGSGTAGSGVILQSNATSGAVFAVAAPGTGIHPCSSMVLPSFENIVIKCAAGGSALDLLNANGASLDNVQLTGAYSPGDSSFGIQTPQLTVGDFYTMNNLVVYGFHSAAVITESAHFTGVFWVENNDISVLCNGGTNNTIEYLNAYSTTVFATAGSGIETHITVTNMLYQPGSQQLINDPTNRLRGSIRLASPTAIEREGPGGSAVYALTSMGAVVGGASGGASDLDMAWDGAPGSRARHPRDNFARAGSPPAASGYPGICSDTLHSWRALGTMSITQVNSGTTGQYGKLFSTVAGGYGEARVRTLDGYKGGLSRVVEGTFTLAGASPRMAVRAHLVHGGTNNGQVIQAQLISGVLYLQVAGNNVGNVSGLMTSGNTYTVGVAVVIGADGLPNRTYMMVNGVRCADHWLTTAERNVFTGGVYPYFEDGLFYYSDTSSYCTLFNVRELEDGTGPSVRAATTAAAQSGGGTLTLDSNGGTWQTVTVADATAFTIAAPSHAPDSTLTQRLTVEVYNNSGGAMGAITWNAAFVFAGLAWANPASTKKRYAEFEWSGTAWVCKAIAASDY